MPNRTGNGPRGRKKALAVVLMALALGYDLLPTALISDFIAIVGWSDDLLVPAHAAANLVDMFGWKWRSILKGVAVLAVFVLLSSAALLTYLFVRLGMYLFGGGAG